MKKWRAIIELADGQEVEVEEYEAEDEEDAYHSLFKYFAVYEVEE